MFQLNKLICLQIDTLNTSHSLHSPVKANFNKEEKALKYIIERHANEVRLIGSANKFTKMAINCLWSVANKSPVNECKQCAMVVYGRCG